MPGKIEVAHHTLADWDYEQGALYRSLSATYFISAPTSLKYTIPAGGASSVNLCRIPATQVLPQGEVRTWVRRPSPHFMPAVFRSQAALGTADNLNNYQIHLTYTTALLVRYLAGVYSQRDNTTCYSAVDEWRHTRVFWYNGKTPGEVPALCVDLYREVAGEWIKEGETMYDTDNSWKDSAINRCGFRPLFEKNYPCYFDDTEIWGPV